MAKVTPVGASENLPKVRLRVVKQVLGESYHVQVKDGDARSKHVLVEDTDLLMVNKLPALLESISAPRVETASLST